MDNIKKILGDNYTLSSMPCGKIIIDLHELNVDPWFSGNMNLILVTKKGDIRGDRLVKLINDIEQSPELYKQNIVLRLTPVVSKHLNNDHDRNKPKLLDFLLTVSRQFTEYSVFDTIILNHNTIEKTLYAVNHSDNQYILYFQLVKNDITQLNENDITVTI